MRKRLTALILTIAMITLLLPVGAMAEGEVADAAGLQTALGGGSYCSLVGTTVKLLQNIDFVAEAKETIMVTSGTMTLDLNGYTITGSNAGNHGNTVFSIEDAAKFTVCDTSANGTGTITANTAGNLAAGAPAICFHGDGDAHNGSLTIEGGNFIGSSGTSVGGAALEIDNAVSGVKVTIKGGTFTGGSDADAIKGNYATGDDHQAITQTDKSIIVLRKTLESVKYIDENGVEKEATGVNVLGNNSTNLSNGWYVVKSKFKIEHIQITDTANLILADGCELNVEEGIELTTGNTLKIYAQTTGTGALNATQGSHYPAIGGGIVSSALDCGDLIICGGSISATKSHANAVAIGGGTGANSSGAGGSITIYNGTLTAKNNAVGGFAIGGGYRIDNGARNTSNGTITLKTQNKKFGISYSEGGVLTPVSQTTYEGTDEIFSKDYVKIAPLESVPAPTNPVWDGQTAKWTKATDEANIINYKVALYCGNNKVDEKTVSGESIDLGSLMESTGTYYFIVRSEAKDGTNKSPSAWVRSNGIAQKLDGKGTIAEPYLIRSAADLYYMRDISQKNGLINGDNGVNANTAAYKLMGNITLSGEWTPIGRQDNSTVYGFNGVFDGGGFKIDGLVSSTGGLFNTVDVGLVKNLKVDAKISVNTSIENDEFGIIANQCNGVIDNCSTSGSIVAASSKTGLCIGGVAGCIVRSQIEPKITNCISSVSITVTPTSRSFTGGIVGLTSSLSPDSDKRVIIANCGGCGTINSSGDSDSYAGGIVGQARYCNILNCYFNGSVDGSANKDSVCPLLYEQATVEHCYPRDFMLLSYAELNTWVNTPVKNTCGAREWTSLTTFGNVPKTSNAPYYYKAGANEYYVFANGNNITISSSGNNTLIQYKNSNISGKNATDRDSGFLSTDVVHVYGGGWGEDVSGDPIITVQGGKVADISGDGLGGSVNGEKRVVLSGYAVVTDGVRLSTLKDKAVEVNGAFDTSASIKLDVTGIDDGAVVVTATDESYIATDKFMVSDGRTLVKNGKSLLIMGAGAIVPTINIQPATPIAATEGKTVSMSVEATAADGHTLSYQWYECDADGSNRAPRPGATSSTFSTDDLTEGNHYFRCGVTATRTSDNVNRQRFSAMSQR